MGDASPLSHRGDSYSMSAAQQEVLNHRSGNTVIIKQVPGFDLTLCVHKMICKELCGARE